MVQSLQNALSTFLEYIPQLIGAILILIIGCIVARILQAVVARILQAVGFDRWMEHGGIKQFFDRAQTRETPATVLGRYSKATHTGGRILEIRSLPSAVRCNRGDTKPRVLVVAGERSQRTLSRSRRPEVRFTP